MITWRAGCAGTCTSGSAGGDRKTCRRKPARRPVPDPTGRLHGLEQAAGHSEPVDGQRVLEALAQGRGGAGPLLVQRPRERGELTLGGVSVRVGPGGTQLALDQRPFRLRQVGKDVAFLVGFMPISA